MNDTKSTGPLRSRLHEIIFEADTSAGKLFDVLLIASILLSVAIVMLDSVDSIQLAYGRWLYFGEWLFTIFFTKSTIQVGPNTHLSYILMKNHFLADEAHSYR